MLEFGESAALRRNQRELKFEENMTITSGTFSDSEIRQACVVVDFVEDKFGSRMDQFM